MTLTRRRTKTTNKALPLPKSPNNANKPTVHTKPKWKSTYKSLKLKEKMLYQDIVQMAHKLHQHYLAEYQPMEELYAPAEHASDAWRLDRFHQETNSLQQDRSLYSKHLLHQLGVIQSQVAQLHSLLERHQAKPSPGKLQQIHTLAEEANSLMHRFKDQHRTELNQHIHNQQLLQNELSVCLDRIKLLEQKSTNPPATAPPDTATPPKPPSASHTANTHNQNQSIPDQIKHFNHFIATTGGKYGSWDFEDHKLFLALKAKFPNTQAFIAEAAKRIPAQTPFTIQQHLTWYKQYQHFKKLKNDAIQQWKEEKEQNRREQVKLREENELKQMEDDDHQRHKQMLRERQRKKERIRQWKEEKKRKEFHEEQRIQQQHQLEQKLQAQREELRQKEVKAQLDQYKQQKETSEQEKKLAEELANKPRPPSAQELRRLQERNLKMAKRRLELKSRKERQRHMREERLQRMAEAVHVEGKRDASRLTSETAAHKSRVQDLRAHGADSRGNHNFNIRHVQHRAQPSWRRAA